MKGMRPFTDEEVKEINQSFTGKFEHRDRAIFLLGVKAGFRISEILSLRIKDVIQTGQMVDRVTVSRKNMKRKIEGRTVLLHPEAKHALSKVIASDADPNAFIFSSRNGLNKPLSRYGALNNIQTLTAELGLQGKIGTHSMRKTFANKVYDALDHDLWKTSKALGHKTINSTIQYLSFREEEIDAAILTI